MTRAPVIVLLHRQALKAWDLDPDEAVNLVTGLDPAARVRLVETWSEAGFGDIPSGAPVVLAGPAEPVPESVPLTDQYLLDFNAANWLGGDVSERLGLLLKAKVIEAVGALPQSVLSFEPFDRVLVFGFTRAGRQAAAALGEAGLKTVWAGPETEIDPGILPGDVEILTGYTLLDVTGFAGRFTIGLSGRDEKRELNAAAVLLCGPEERQAHDRSGLGAVSLTGFDAGLEDGSFPALWARPGFKIVFMARPAVSIDNMRRILGLALRLIVEASAQVYISSPQVKVAGTGLERLYGKARDTGVVFLRSPGTGPSLEIRNGRLYFRAPDPIVQADLVFSPDLVVMAEDLIPTAEFQQLCERQGLVSGPDGYPAPDNVLFQPAATNRRGIMVLGPARGTDDAEVLDMEIAWSVAEARGLLALRDSIRPPVVVDEEKCARCLTCLRTCPHQAIFFTNRPWPNPSACTACGLCAARCPAKALDLIGAGESQALGQLRSYLDRPRENRPKPPRLIMFGCRRSAQAAFQAAPHPDFPVDLAFLPLPCGGKLDENLVLQAFLHGADGVLAAVCHEDNCRTQAGSLQARRRLAVLKKMMPALGLDPRRLTLLSLAPNMGVDFKRMVADFTKEIKELIPGRAVGKKL